MKLPKHDRYDYSVIDERPDYDWPDGKRLAFCATTNVEVYAYRKGTGWDPAKANEPQNQRNYSWRDYGNRVGIWRMFDLFDELGIPAAHNINSMLYDYCPEITDRMRERGDEIIGHGRTNSERQGDLWEDRREAADRRCHRDHPQARRRAAEGLDGPGRLGIGHHARPSQGGRLQIHHGLAGRRPAVLAPHSRRPAALGALSGRTQQFGRDHPSPQRHERFRRHDRRPVRRDDRAMPTSSRWC